MILFNILEGGLKIWKSVMSDFAVMFIILTLKPFQIQIRAWKWCWSEIKGSYFFLINTNINNINYYSDLDAHREIGSDTASIYAQQNNISFIESSALNNHNVATAFIHLVTGL